MVREPLVAGQYYPAEAQDCARELLSCIPTQGDVLDAGLQPLGGLVPHAGWICSGRIAGRVLRTLADSSSPATIVLIGAVHAPRGRLAAVYHCGAWETPLGQVAVDEELAEALCSTPDLFERNPHAHDDEHSLEVQVPFVQTQFPGANILPVMVPPSPLAAPIGQAIGQTLMTRSANAIVVGTSDLTHYGPSYRFTPHGVGQSGLDWAKTVNDRRIIDRILALDAEGIVLEAAEHHNACGGGAIAATIAACRVLGASRAVLLEHATSQETLAELRPGLVTDAVGYAGVVFCR